MARGAASDAKATPVADQINPTRTRQPSGCTCRRISHGAGPAPQADRLTGVHDAPRDAGNVPRDFVLGPAENATDLAS